MKLAEALVLRADAQKRLEQLKQRLLRVAKVQEGDKPSEDPTALMREFESLADELMSLIRRINRTNATAEFQGATLMDALARRDVLRLRVAAFRDLTQAAAIVQTRLGKSEVKFRSTVSVAEIQKKVDALAKEHRELDARIQEANWQFELLE
jgi:hypothetical protein